MKLIMITASVITLGAGFAYAQGGTITTNGTTTNGVLNNNPPMVNNGVNPGTPGTFQDQQMGAMRNSDRYARSQNQNQLQNQNSTNLNGFGVQPAPSPGTNQPTPLYEINPSGNGQLNTNH